MSRWNHAICDECWTKLEPDRTPVTAADVHSAEICGWCGRPTTSGIYVREHPDKVPFSGVERGEQ